MSKKHKEVCETLNYMEQFLYLASTITGCVFISTFPSLVVFSIGITSSTIRLQIGAIIAGNKKHKSKIK